MRSVPTARDASSSLLEDVEVAVVVHDASGRVTLSNARASQLLGLSLAELRGVEPLPAGWALVGDDGNPLAPAALPVARVIASGLAIADFTVGVRRPREADVAWARVHAGPRFDAAGQLAQVVATWVDITASRQVEQALRDSELKYRTLFASMDAAVLLMAGNVCVDCNPATATLFGLPDRASILGKTPLDFAPEFQPDGRRSADLVAENIALSLQQHGRAFEWHTTRADGTPIILEVLFTPFGLGAGTLFQCIARDITRRKHAEANTRLLEEERLRTQKLEAVGILAGGIAHDFNNLLQAVFGFVAIAKEAGAMAEAKLHLEHAEEALELAVGLTTQLLTFSRGGHPVKRLMGVAATVEGAARLALSGSRNGCVKDLPDDLWPVEGDAGQLAQVFQNIVLNADQAMPSGGTVSIAARNAQAPGATPPQLPQGRYVAIEVRDEGVGIRPENLARVFDPYFTTKARGSGLGLATAYSIIRNHGGFVDVKSTPGAGSTFTVYLPATEVPLPAMAANAPAPRPRTLKVLIMDDEELIRRVTGNLLRLLGHEVALAEHGGEALQLYEAALAQGSPYEAVILDLTVRGGMGGLETLKSLRELDPGVKAIVSSGYSEDAAVAEHREHGFAAALNKPYTFEQLKQVLGSLVA